MRTTVKLGCALVCIPTLMALGLLSCARVTVSGSHRGVVVDAENGVPLADVAILVQVMRVSSYDGTSHLAQHMYKSNERGEFRLPSRKKIVDSITERMEEMHYYELIAFGKRGYVPKEFRTDDDHSPFAVLNHSKEPIVIHLEKVSTEPPP